MCFICNLAVYEKTNLEIKSANIVCNIDQYIAGNKSTTNWFWASRLVHVTPLKRKKSSVCTVPADAMHFVHSKHM